MNKIIRLTKGAWRLFKLNGIKDLIYVTTRYLKSNMTQKAKKKLDYFELVVSEKEKQFVVPKTGRTVYIVTASSYYDTGGGQRGAQLARAFNRMGYKAKFLYVYISSDPQKGDYRFPLETHRFIDESTIQFVKDNATAKDLFIFESPLQAFEPIIDIAVECGSKIVYENIDNWETSLGKNIFSSKILIELLTHADVLVGTAKPLVTQLNDYLVKYNIEQKDRKILYLPNAVDEELFCGLKKHEKPSDMVSGTKTLLYYGSLWGEWFEWNLLIDFAKKHPDYAINLIGNDGGLNHIMKRCPGNVHFLGHKAQDELPAYLQYCDFSLIPFERGKIGDYVSPVKVFEYIAMYSNVISTSLPDIQGYPNVYCGDTVEEWEDIVVKATTADKESADIFVSDNSWFSRASAILDALYESETCLKDNLSIVILNYNNKNVIFKCVNSLLKYREKYGYKIVVVDNGSKDGSYEMLGQYSPEDVTVCRNKENGCASGRNLGMTFVDTEYVLFLDSDQWISNKYWLQPYEEIMSKCEDFGAIGWAAGFFNPSGSTGKTVATMDYKGVLPQNLCRNDIGYLGAGGMLMRADDFNAIGGFDTAYDPTGFEDTDISLKMRDYGKELYYCPYLGVIHLPHQTTANVFDLKDAMIKKNQDLFISKWKEKKSGLLDYRY